MWTQHSIFYFIVFSYSLLEISFSSSFCHFISYFFLSFLLFLIYVCHSIFLFLFIIIFFMLIIPSFLSFYHFCFIRNSCSFRYSKSLYYFRRSCFLSFLSISFSRFCLSYHFLVSCYFCLFMLFLSFMLFSSLFDVIPAFGNLIPEKSILLRAFLMFIPARFSFVIFPRRREFSVAYVFYKNL